MDAMTANCLTTPSAMPEDVEAVLHLKTVVEFVDQQVARRNLRLPISPAHA
jgi:hypothetical protein